MAGAPRDSLYVLDILYDRDGGRRPKMIVTDIAPYSDIVFGLLTLAGFAYAPQPADLPDQKMWRIDRAADYGAFQEAAATGSALPGPSGTARTSCGVEDQIDALVLFDTRYMDAVTQLRADGF